MSLVSAGANRHDKTLLKPILQAIALPRPAPTPARPQGLYLNKGYDYDDVRNRVPEFGYTAWVSTR